MNAPALINFLTVAWLIGGIFFFPFNSFLFGALFCLKFDLDLERDWKPVMIKAWALQIVLNILFFSFCLLLGSASGPLDPDPVQNFFWTIAVVLIPSVLAPFGWIVLECSGIGIILNPIWGVAIFGPSLFKIFSALRS